MPASPRTTLLEVVNIIAQSIGHSKAVDVAGSTDEAILRMVYYVNIACTELSYMHNWQWLDKTFEIVLAADFDGQTEKAFDLPADFHAMVDDTQWNRNTQLPAIGPVNSQDWQWLIVRKAMITTRTMWRIRDKKFWVKSPPSASSPQTLTLEYLSRSWAVNGATEAPQDVLTANNDYHRFPWQLPVLFGRAKWFENEGYDSSAAYSDFNRALAYETGVDKAATALTLVPGHGYPYIDAIKNVPDTGYGSS
jgi:hypothetical protein